jgi:hypothetical protein
MCLSAPGNLSEFIPDNPREAVDPHNFRTNSDAEKRHEKLGIHQPEMPDPPAPVKPPQAGKAPDVSPLKKRNQSGGFAAPSGSTVLTGPSGISLAQLNLGGATALGG